ncbi:MAG: class I SAM-dependent methyltransferase [Lachnospiraceae bacterium]|nr:class I SAM-dependent methyltransferase [Lachnospiraceae bacterium]
MDRDIQKIGQVTLDYSYYSGEDLYSEGASEDALLEIVKNHTESEYNRVIGEEMSWSTLYHLSHLRGNIVDFLPIHKDQNVLEIGAGCGAITGTVSKKAGHVTCVELSRKRSEINAWRNRKRSNIEILVGNFQEIEPHLSKQYDYILLIGVLEYAVSYIKDEDPFLKMLLLLKRHLAHGGQIVVAIENKYGMKYFAGCREDHTGRYFDGIEGYPNGSVAKTFSKAALTKLVRQAGYEYTFMYPYPDYKLPITIYSDERLPSRGDFHDNMRNFDGERLTAFNESAALDEALRDGYFPFFSNSYLVILQKEGRLESMFARHPIYSKHSNERSPHFQIRTDVEVDGNHRSVVVKYPLTDEAVSHLERMEAAYRELSEELKDSSFSPNSCKAIYSHDGRLTCLEFEFLVGKTMSDGLDSLINAGRPEECINAIVSFARALRNLVSRDFWATQEFADVFGVTGVPGEHKSLMLTDVDMLFDNLIYNKCWNIIDYEWTFDFPIPVDFVIYRSVEYYMDSLCGESLNKEELYRELGITEEERKAYHIMELSFQKYIAGDHISLKGMYSIFGGNNVMLEETMNLSRRLGRPANIWAYFDYGKDFQTDSAVMINAERDTEDKITIDFDMPEDAVGIRIDPSDYPCMVQIIKVSLNGIPSGECMVNGTVIARQVVLFDTADGQIRLLHTPKGAHLHMEYYIASHSERFWKPLAFEFAIPRKNEGSYLNRLIYGTRDEFIKMRLDPEGPEEG